ncbi:ACT domain-containing protein [Euzebya rosea]|uniref:ACT domain-containing protein n=1 Tax=Euzebya rosea TaxID=2052804 RepID=UPI000D3E926D|nr:ACT domain-containing protein [Euzebya rosea]
MRFALRLSLPDRRGALSAVASAIGRAGANIVSLDVVGIADGMAIDDVTVQSDVPADILRRAVEEVPSVVVEAIRETDTFRDPTAPLGLATEMVAAGSGAVPLLVNGLIDALWVSWAMVVAASITGPQVLHASGDVPGIDELETPWLPIEDLRRLNRAPWMPAAWREQHDLEVVAAPLSQRNTALLVGRTEGPRFLDSELTQLQRLARIAVKVEVMAGNGNGGTR